MVAKMIVSVLKKRCPGRASEPSKRICTWSVGCPIGITSLSFSSGAEGVGSTAAGSGVGVTVGIYTAVGGRGWKGVGVAVASAAPWKSWATGFGLDREPIGTGILPNPGEAQAVKINTSRRSVTRLMGVIDN